MFHHMQICLFSFYARDMFVCHCLDSMELKIEREKFRHHKNASYGAASSRCMRIYYYYGSIHNISSLLMEDCLAGARKL